MKILPLASGNRKQQNGQTIYFILAILCVLSIAYIAGRCSTKKERNTSTANLIAARDSIHTFKVSRYVY